MIFLVSFCFQKGVGKEAHYAVIGRKGSVSKINSTIFRIVEGKCSQMFTIDLHF